MGNLTDIMILKMLWRTLKSKETFFFVLGLFFFLLAWLWLEADRIYIGYVLLAVGFLLIVKSLNIHSLAIGKSGLEMCLKESIEIQKDLKSTLHVIVPIIARMAMSEQHQRLVPRRFVYKLLREIEDDRQLGNDEKNALCEDLKWVLIDWFIQVFGNEPIIQSLQDNPRFSEKNRIIKDGIKNIFDPKQYELQWARIQVRNLRDHTITNALNEQEKAEYNSIIEYYARRIEDLIDLGIIEPDFFRTGQ